MFSFVFHYSASSTGDARDLSLRGKNELSKMEETTKSKIPSDRDPNESINVRKTKPKPPTDRGPNESIKRKGIASKLPSDLQPYRSPLIIFTYNRPDYLHRSLSEIYENIPQSCVIGCPVIISQDGDVQNVTDVIKSFQKRHRIIPTIHLKHKHHLEVPELDLENDNDLVDYIPDLATLGYKALAQHYHWGLETVFSGIENYPRPERLIVLEEDLLISHDFFDYFAYMAPYLDKDESLLAVSAFNDNGKNGLVKDSTRVLRSDFFPGLGWMITQDLWSSELSAKWPDQYWDDWLRDPDQRKGRQILRPEVSRTYHFGVVGTSDNQFGDTLSAIYLNEENVDWSKVDLSYLEKSAFEASYFSLISKAQPANDIGNALTLCKNGDVRLEYNSMGRFSQIAELLGIMNDEKSGILRTAYRGIVEIRPYGGYILFLVQSMEDIETKMIQSLNLLP